MEELQKAYGKSGSDIAASYQSWRLYSKVPYVSFTHGERYVTNYANAAAKAYGAYESSGVMPEGAKLAKDSFSVTAGGQVSIGPLFIMEKMGAGFAAETNDWRYSMIMPNGAVFGVTGGKGSDNVQFCADCHMATDTDSMFFLPEEYRVK